MHSGSSSSSSSHAGSIHGATAAAIDFAGSPTLDERARMLGGCSGETKCGFMMASGYDELAKRASRLSKACTVVVLTAIFDSKDKLQQPSGTSGAAAEGTMPQPEQRDCYFAFVDEKSAEFVAATAPKAVKREAGQDWPEVSRSRVGAWQLLVLRSGEWPYGQPRRASRVPKFLPFRLFPHSKYSVWVDGKLKLLASPMSLIQRFLIGPGASLALPRNLQRDHLDEEVEWIRATLASAPSKMRPGEMAAVESQWQFYLAEQGGYSNNASDWVRRSACAEGALILADLRSPLAQCMMCSWFNEWHRFAERDQLSFSYVLMVMGLTPPPPRDEEEEGLAPTLHHAGVHLWPRSEHWHHRKIDKMSSSTPPYVRYVGHGGCSEGQRNVAGCPASTRRPN